jgi:hypothetical protein
LKTVFELIEENGLTLHGDIEHFAALVIANHPPQSYMSWQEGYEEGKLAERARLQAFMRQMLDAYSLPSDPSGLRARSST